MQLMDEIRSENGANILSLFDGMACGLVAMIESGVKVNRYIAYEIDKYAVKTSQHNFPFIEHKGDVFQADFTEYRGGLDYLIGGSPCTYWSIAQKNNRETEASGLGWELFSQYVRALHESEPDFFIYENNKSMSNAIRESITKAFGFEPICINSALVSAQNRQRLYWVGKRNEDGSYSKVEIEQPVDRGILLRDILEYGTWINPTNNSKSRTIHAGMSRLEHNMIPRINHENPAKQQHNCIVEPVNVTSAGKAQYLRATCYKDGIRNMVGNNVDRKTCVAESVYVGELPGHNGEYRNGKQPSQQYRVYSSEGKAVCCDRDARKWYSIPVCVAERGRYVDGNINQHFEARDDGKTNTLTTVQKDNNIAEPVWFGNVETAFAIPSKFDGDIPVKAISASDSIGDMVGNNVDRKTCVAEPIEMTEIHIRNNAHIVINDNAIRGVQDKNNVSYAECFYEFTDRKSNTLTTAHTPKIIENISNALGYAIACESDSNGNPTRAISASDGKTYTVYKVNCGQITINESTYPIKLNDGFYIIRKLTVGECKKLQTVPDWYEFPVSNSQAYKMLGNGWTCSVISHLINATLENK